MWLKRLREAAFGALNAAVETLSCGIPVPGLSLDQF